MTSSRYCRSNSNEDEFDDSQLFVSINLKDRENFKKMLKIDEATEQADLERFKHRLQNDRRSPLLKCESNSRSKSLPRRPFLGYGSDIKPIAKNSPVVVPPCQPTGAVAGSSGSSGSSTSKKIEAVESRRLVGRVPPSTRESIAKHNCALEGGSQTTTGQYAEQPTTQKCIEDIDSMESSIIILTEQEFYATSGPDTQTDKSIEKETATTVKCGEPSGPSHSHELLQDLIADAMEDHCSVDSGSDECHLNITNVSDPDSIDIDWNKLDLSPTKPAGSTRLLTGPILHSAKNSTSKVTAARTDSISSDEFVMVDNVRANADE